MRIDTDKMDEVLRNIGSVYFTAGTIGLFLNFSTEGAILAIIAGILCISSGTKEKENDN